MPKRRRIDPELYDAIHEMVRTGRFTNATAIHRQLQQRFPDKPVSERTVRYIVNELEPPSTAGTWGPELDQAPQEARLVLEAWAALLEKSQGRTPKGGLSRELARWIAWVRVGWPDLDPVMAAVLAQDYLARRQANQPTRDLDGFLAFAPWQSVEAMERYARAVDQGWVPPLPRMYRVSFLASHGVVRAVARKHAPVPEVWEEVPTDEPSGKRPQD